MTVELAVLVPPAIVVALIVFNLMGFIDACAVFDQASLDAVLAHGVAPVGAQTSDTAEAEVAAAIRRALGNEGRARSRFARAGRARTPRQARSSYRLCSRGIPARSATSRGRASCGCRESRWRRLLPSRTSVPWSSTGIGPGW